MCGCVVRVTFHISHPFSCDKVVPAKAMERPSAFPVHDIEPCSRIVAEIGFSMKHLDLVEVQEVGDVWPTWT